MLLETTVYNYINDSVRDNKLFVEDTKQASEMLYDLIDEVLFKNENREVKVFENRDKGVIYVLEKNKYCLKVYTQEVYDFEKDRPVNELLMYPIKYLNEDKKLHLPVVFSFPYGDLNEVINIDKELEELDNGGEIDKEKLQELIKKLSKNTDEAMNHDQLLFDASLSLEHIRDFVDILENKKLTNNHYDINFYKSLTSKLNTDMTKGFKDLTKKMNYLIKICENNNFTTLDNTFEFNDLDNHVCLHNGNLVIKDQNIGFYCRKVDDKNYTFYLLDEYTETNKEIKRIENSIKNNTIDELRDIALKVENGKVTLTNNSLMYCFNLDVIYSCEAMIKEGYKSSGLKEVKAKSMKKGI